MINDIFAFWVPGPLELLIIFIIFGIPVLLIVLFMVYVVRGSKERRRLRLELGKLADELEQVRKQKKANEKRDSTDKSG